MWQRYRARQLSDLHLRFLLQSSKTSIHVDKSKPMREFRNHPGRDHKAQTRENGARPGRIGAAEPRMRECSSYGRLRVSGTGPRTTSAPPLRPPILPRCSGPGTPASEAQRQLVSVTCSRARHDCLTGRKALFDQRRHVVQGGRASHDGTLLSGVEKMDLTQVDARVAEQRNGMGRHQHLPPRRSVHPRHETGEAGNQGVVKTQLRLFQEQRAAWLGK